MAALADTKVGDILFKVRCGGIEQRVMGGIGKYPWHERKRVKTTTAGSVATVTAPLSVFREGSVLNDLQCFSFNGLEFPFNIDENTRKMKQRTLVILSFSCSTCRKTCRWLLIFPMMILIMLELSPNNEMSKINWN
jgi:hypothetical protein